MRKLPLTPKPAWGRDGDLGTEAGLWGSVLLGYLVFDCHGPCKAGPSAHPSHVPSGPSGLQLACAWCGEHIPAPASQPLAPYSKGPD